MIESLENSLLAYLEENGRRTYDQIRKFLALPTLSVNNVLLRLIEQQKIVVYDLGYYSIKHADRLLKVMTRVYGDLDSTHPKREAELTPIYSEILHQALRVLQKDGKIKFIEKKGWVRT